MKLLSPVRAVKCKRTYCNFSRNLHVFVLKCVFKQL